MPNLRTPLRAPAQLNSQFRRPKRQCNFHSHHRFASTSAFGNQPSPPSQNRSSLFSTRNQIYAAIFLCVGACAGYTTNFIVRPPPFPEPGSEEDGKLLASLAGRIDKLPIVQEMRKNARMQRGGKDGAIMKRVADELSEKSANSSMDGDEDGDWVELETEYERSKPHVNGGMGGFKGLGVQRAFWSEERKELVMIIWFGGALTGWPGITHGGAIVTMFMEAMEKAVGCALSSRNNPNVSAPKPPEPTTLSLTYLKPTRANDMYILRTQLTEQEPTPKTSISADKDLTKKHHNQGRSITFALNRKYELDGVIEMTNGKACVKAKATWDIV